MLRRRPAAVALPMLPDDAGPGTTGPHRRPSPAAASPPASLAAGLAWAMLAVAIWSGWVVMTAVGVVSTLTPWDLSLMRVGVPAVLLAPLLWRERRRVASVGAGRGVLMACYGAPFTLLVGFGLQFAPVAHAAAIAAGTMPLLAAGLGALFLRETFTPRRRLGLLLIVAATAVIGVDSGALGGFGEVTIGHLLFLGGAAGWAVFTVVSRPLGLSPFLATGIVALYSTAALLPAYLAFGLGRAAAAPLSEVLAQLIFQGVVSGLVSLYAYSRAIAALGASQAAAFASLVPTVAALMAVPALGQSPSGAEVAAMVVVGAGVFFASGARLPRIGR